jgi:DNA (cytosine-5)-methyltransferase 1
MKVVELTRPAVFVLENVPPILKSAEFAEMKRLALDMGYFPPAASILNAADYGVPQTRKRAIAIFSRLAEPELPTPTHRSPGSVGPHGDARPKWVTLREALRGIPKDPQMERRGTGPACGPELHIGRNPTKKSVTRYRHIPEGGNRWHLPKKLTPACWIKKTQGGTDLFGRLWRDRPAFTIRTEFFKPEKGRYLHPTADRPITHWEAARIQTFPDTFAFCGPKIEIARQIGNAVPCKLAEAIARCVLRHLQEVAHEVHSRRYQMEKAG